MQLVTNDTDPLALVVNLANAARWHGEHCDSECSVSLSMLKELASRFANEFLGVDYDEAMTFVETMPDGSGSPKKGEE